MSQTRCTMTMWMLSVLMSSPPALVWPPIVTRSGSEVPEKRIGKGICVLGVSGRTAEARYDTALLKKLQALLLAALPAPAVRSHDPRSSTR